MLLKLEEVSGLSDADPIHRHLKLVDGFLKNKRWWYEVQCRLSEDELIALMWKCVRHPVDRKKVTLDQIVSFRDSLTAEGEPVIASIVNYLCFVCPSLGTSLTAHEIRMTMMFIIVNLNHLREREREQDWGKLKTRWNEIYG